MIQPRNINPSDYKISEEALRVALAYDKTYDEDLKRSARILLGMETPGEAGEVVSLGLYKE